MGIGRGQAGRWRGGFTAQAESRELSGAIHHEPGVGSFDLPERWVGFAAERGRATFDVRMGTSFGQRFAEGLVLGSASFEGVTLDVDTGRRLRVTALSGETESLDPLEFFDEPLTLFPDDHAALVNAAKKAGISLDGPHPALLVQGDDELGSLASVHSRLYEASVNVYASSGVTDGKGCYGYVVYVRPEEYERAAAALEI